MGLGIVLASLAVTALLIVLAVAATTPPPPSPVTVSRMSFQIDLDNSGPCSGGSFQAGSITLNVTTTENAVFPWTFAVENPLNGTCDLLQVSVSEGFRVLSTAPSLPLPLVGCWGATLNGTGCWRSLTLDLETPEAGGDYAPLATFDVGPWLPP